MSTDCVLSWQTTGDHHRPRVQAVTVQGAGRHNSAGWILRFFTAGQGTRIMPLRIPPGVVCAEESRQLSPDSQAVCVNFGRRLIRAGPTEAGTNMRANHGKTSEEVSGEATDQLQKSSRQENPCARSGVAGWASPCRILAVFR